ncbi:hypothetical protein JG687_00017016 [Phytophthora cactorum]|uniref:Uncharacterized protein n=2 Tax=Phytophthora cactorum TaxID=29920 RepID=A0A8T1TP69_9STRA|nr:hypothetical protein JG687_00017016 [Phytophthora cactorum]
MASDDAAAMVSMLIGDSSDRGSRHPAPASALLWSRIAVLEELQHKLHDMEKHLVALARAVTNSTRVPGRLDCLIMVQWDCVLASVTTVNKNKDNVQVMLKSIYVKTIDGKNDIKICQ